jgi:hypothetical protein
MRIVMRHHSFHFVRVVLRVMISKLQISDNVLTPINSLTLIS